jgi:hypothetical protein
MIVFNVLPIRSPVQTAGGRISETALDDQSETDLRKLPLQFHLQEIISVEDVSYPVASKCFAPRVAIAHLLLRQML